MTCGPRDKEPAATGVGFLVLFASLVSVREWRPSDPCSVPELEGATRKLVLIDRGQQEFEPVQNRLSMRFLECDHN